MGTVHRYHPDPDKSDPTDAILYDDCERCDEHAEQLWSLDSDHLYRLLLLMRGDDPKTKTAARARNRLSQCLAVADRLRRRAEL